MVVEGNHWALHFGESGKGKAPDNLSSDKTGSYRNKYEIPLTMEDPWELLQKTGISPGFTVSLGTLHTLCGPQFTHL